ncbi:MAG: hypothetical protein RLY22_111 [Actinomycetota bacterium]|jgi:hypothetical protein
MPERTNLSAFRPSVDEKNVNDLGGTFVGFGAVLQISDEEFMPSGNKFKGSKIEAIYYRILTLQVTNANDENLKQISFLVHSDFEPKVSLDEVAVGDQIFFVAGKKIDRFTEQATYTFNYLGELDETAQSLKSLTRGDQPEIPTSVLKFK